MKEEWKNIKNYEGLYQISNTGKVKSLERKTKIPHAIRTEQEKILKLGKRNGYYVLTLNKNNKRKAHQVHRLVAEAFIPNPENKPFVNHKDFNPLNNNLNNLEWVTQKENVNWSICNMQKRKKITHSNTGEKYITYRKSNKRYRVIIDGKEYKSCNSLEKAIEERNKILNGEI